MKQKGWIQLHIVLILRFAIAVGSVNSGDIKGYSSGVIPTADYNSTDDVSKKCLEDSRLLLNALLNQEECALSMFQASGKLPFDGSSTDYLFAGAKETRYEPGLFDECISSGNSIENIRGQYCSVFITAEPLDPRFDGRVLLDNPRATVALRQRNTLFLYDFKPVADVVVGLCLPSSCSARDVRNSIANKIGRTVFRLPNHDRNRSSPFSFVTSTHDRFCHTESKIQEQSSLDGFSIAFIIVLSFIIGLVLASTILDARNFQFLSDAADGQVSPLMEKIHCFSVARNIREFLKDSGGEEIGCLNGIRALTSLVTVSCHLAITGLAGVVNQGSVHRMMASWHTFPFINVINYLMDCCFLIGGICTSISMLHALNRRSFNIFSFYFHRFLRMTPLYFMILLFIATLAGRLGSGPNWNYVQYASEDCRSNWLYHLLYVNNWSPDGLTFCMVETWYSAADMQLLILSPLFVYPLWRWPKKYIGPSLILAGLLVGHLYSLIVYQKWNIPLFLILSRKSSFKQAPEYTAMYYVKTLNRLTPYLIGILLGWILHRTKNSKLVIKKGSLIFYWILSGLVIFVVNYGLFPFADEDASPVINPVLELVFGLFQRTLWSANLAWIIFLCVNGYGGILNRFLSSKTLTLVSRLSYAIYLVNHNFIIGYASQLRIPIHANPLNLLINAIGMVVLILGISVILVIVIEMPFRKLERIFFSSRDATTSAVLKNPEKRKNLHLSDTRPGSVPLPLKGSKEY